MPHYHGFLYCVSKRKNNDISEDIQGMLSPGQRGILLMALKFLGEEDP